MEIATLVIAILTFLYLFAVTADIKSRCERLEQKLNLLLDHDQIDPLKSFDLSDRVKEIARDPSRKIEAIKVYREETGAGLADAKNAVEAYINMQ